MRLFGFPISARHTVIHARFYREVITMPEKDFLQLEELAAELGVTSVAIRASMKDDDLPARKIGGKWFFSRQAIHEWLGQGTWASEKARRGADGAQDDDGAE